MAKQVPVVFYTNVRKIEPIGGECVRIYCAVEKNGCWEDRVMLELPVTQIMKNIKFVMEAVNEFYGDDKAVRAPEKLIH